MAYTQDYGTGISGTVLTDRGKPAVNARVNLVFNVGNGIIIDTITNAQGRFNFDYLPFDKGTPFNIAVASAKKKQEVIVELDEQLGPQPITLKHLPEKIVTDNYLNAYLASTRKRFDEMAKYGLISGRLLKEVVINDYNIRETARALATKHSTNLAGPLGTTKTFSFLDIYPYLNSLSTFLSIRARPHFPGQLLIVNGVKGPPMPAPYDIAAIEIIEGGASSLYNASSVMLVTTKTGDIDYDAYIDEYYYHQPHKAKGLKKYVYDGGFEPRREFYAPDYDNSLTNTYMADLRTTIYWNPNIITDMNGKANVEFFNADGAGTYKVITEGLDAQGKLGRQVYKYTVK